MVEIGHRNARDHAKKESQRNSDEIWDDFLCRRGRIRQIDDPQADEDPAQGRILIAGSSFSSNSLPFPCSLTVL